MSRAMLRSAWRSTTQLDVAWRGLLLCRVVVHLVKSLVLTPTHNKHAGRTHLALVWGRRVGAWSMSEVI